MKEEALMSDRIRIVMFGFAHLFISFVFFLWSSAWQMYLMDSGKENAPLSVGFYIVFVIDLLLGLPVRLPVLAAASYIDVSNLMLDNMYLLLPVINSLFAAIVFGFVFRWKRNRDSNIQNNI